MKPKSTLRTGRKRQHAQQGVMLIEALVAIAIFSFAVLGIVGLQATAVRTVRDSDYRVKASQFASQIVGQMWVDRFNVPTFALNAADTACAQGSNVSTNTAVTNWLSDMSTSTNPGSLPGASGLKQQITIDSNNTVTVTLCWQAPQDTAPHNFTLTTQIQG